MVGLRVVVVVVVVEVMRLVQVVKAVVVKVVSQAIDAARARNGSLCGRRAVRWIATARSGEDVGAEVRMAAFAGDQPPGPMGREQDLCGTYNYAAGN